MGPKMDNLTEKPIIKKLAEKYGKSEVQILLAWGLSRDYVVIPKATSEEHLRENFEA